MNEPLHPGSEPASWKDSSGSGLLRRRQRRRRWFTRFRWSVNDGEFGSYPVCFPFVPGWCSGGIHDVCEYGRRPFTVHSKCFLRPVI